jgi:hypothetical protein
VIRHKVTELVAAGASVTGELAYGDQLDHVVMADPEGNGWRERESASSPIRR